MEIIAEIGQNHNGDLGLAFELIHAAKENGAETVKFQVYSAKELFAKEGNPWYDYNCKTEVSYDQLFLLSEECNKVGIEFMASAFDPKRVAWLEEYGVKRHKTASRSIGDKELLRALIKTNKPILCSLGMWDGKEFPVIEATPPVQFLYCIAKYPTPLSDLKFSEVDFNKYAGFSDHTVGIAASLTAFARGAQIIEKHFTLDKSMYGPDHSCSMTPKELKQLSDFRKEVSQCL